MLEKDADMLLEKIKWFLSQSDVSSMVLAIDGKNNPDYQMLKDLADTVADALDRGLPAQAPVILIVQADIAKALGQLVRQKLSKTRSVISLDEICVEQNNFVDFGKPIMNGLVIPVVVKTLIFN